MPLYTYPAVTDPSWPSENLRGVQSYVCSCKDGLEGAARDAIECAKSMASGAKEATSLLDATCSEKCISTFEYMRSSCGKTLLHFLGWSSTGPFFDLLQHACVGDHSCIQPAWDEAKTRISTCPDILEKRWDQMGVVPNPIRIFRAKPATFEFSMPTLPHVSLPWDKSPPPSPTPASPPPPVPPPSPLCELAPCYLPGFFADSECTSVQVTYDALMSLAPQHEAYVAIGGPVCQRADTCEAALAQFSTDLSECKALFGAADTTDMTDMISTMCEPSCVSLMTSIKSSPCWGDLLTTAIGQVPKLGPAINLIINVMTSAVCPMTDEQTKLEALTYIADLFNLATACAAEIDATKGGLLAKFRGEDADITAHVPCPSSCADLIDQITNKAKIPQTAGAQMLFDTFSPQDENARLSLSIARQAIRSCEPCQTEYEGVRASVLGCVDEVKSYDLVSVKPLGADPLCPATCVATVEAVAVSECIAGIAPTARRMGKSLASTCNAFDESAECEATFAPLYTALKACVAGVIFVADNQCTPVCTEAIDRALEMEAACTPLAVSFLEGRRLSSAEPAGLLTGSRVMLPLATTMAAANTSAQDLIFPVPDGRQPITLGDAPILLSALSASSFVGKVARKLAESSCSTACQSAVAQELSACGPTLAMDLMPKQTGNAAFSPPAQAQCTQECSAAIQAAEQACPPLTSFPLLESCSAQLRAAAPARAAPISSVVMLMGVGVLVVGGHTLVRNRKRRSLLAHDASMPSTGDTPPLV